MPTDVVTTFVQDFESGFHQLYAHESGGAWSMVVLSLLLTVYVWYYYGAAAGAPLAASFFICAALLMPSGPG